MATVGLDELARLAVSNLLRAKARLFMTAGGVLVGTAAVTILIGLTIGLQTSAEAGIGQSSALLDIEVYPNWGMEPSASGGTPPQLTPQAVRAFWAIDGVQVVIPIVSLRSSTLILDDLFGGGQIMGIDPRLLPYMNLQAEQGTISLEEGEIVMGAEVARNFYDPQSETYAPIAVDVFTTPPDLQLWDTTGATREVEMRVSGLLAAGGRYDYAILMSLDKVLEYNAWITGQPINPETFVFEQVVVRAASRETATAVSEAIKAMGFSAGGIGEYLNQINGFFTAMRLVLGGVGGIALLVAAFGVANTMTMAILERTREIGLMKAVGARDRDILTVFLIEAGLVGLVGGGAGLTVSYAVGQLINSAIASTPTDPNAMSPLGFIGVNPAALGSGLVLITPELGLFTLALATCVGLGAGVLPALRAARMLTVNALRTE
ncbi:MAG: ABC transporter permease [Chloroflexi bacterium]|nr:ABC transporter permease [Chloroflexota bacterium]